MRQILAAVLIAAPLLAQATEPGDPAAEPALEPIVDIPVEEWTAMSAGRTLTYTIGGALWARERYHPGSNRVTLEFHTGECLEGVWDYATPLYCFDWDLEGTSCFRHVRRGEQILVLQTENGVETGAVQVMAGVSDAPLACGAPPIS